MTLLRRRRVHSPLQRRPGAARRGAAVVECALTAPLLLLAVFGALEVGQFINITQSVCGASRMGSRLAARQTTTTTVTVSSEVKEYLLATGVPNAAVTVTVKNSEGTTVSGAALAAIPSGERLSVTVDVQFSFVRRVSFLSALNGAMNSSTTSMRRE